MGELLARGQPVVLLAAGARAAGGPRDRRRPRAVPPARVRAWATVPRAARLARAGACRVASLAPAPQRGAPRGARLSTEHSTGGYPGITQAAASTPCPQARTPCRRRGAR